MMTRNNGLFVGWALVTKEVMEIVSGRSWGSRETSECCLLLREGTNRSNELQSLNIHSTEGFSCDRFCGVEKLSRRFDLSCVGHKNIQATDRALKGDHSFDFVFSNTLPWLKTKS